MNYRGSVERKNLWPGTKSGHEGVVLVCAAGTFKLRRIGGNAFQDPEIDGLAGRVIECEGVVRGNVLIMKSWKVEK
jgi:hypothetical protein